MKNQKQRSADAVTINGKTLSNVALSKTGIPQLGEGMGFVTIGRSGSVKDRSKKVTA